ncbi:terminase large subunit [Weissella confusa]|uniref:terminase large subunit n=1 Tax=Weissella confusa TaxID=1583 RepID=UPI0018F1B5B2|nr:terminase large subunit [Weissella confusa]MBJ7680496.1 terminase large subunit [Weissella confusa]
MRKYKELFEKYPDDPALTYAVDVLRGRIVAGEKIKRAAERHVSDLERIKDDAGFIYTYNADEAKKIVEFATLLKDVTSGEPFNPSPYQRFILSMIQGWRNPETQGMRFKNILISMARTNGKTQLLSAYTLYNFLFGFPKVNRQLAVSSIDISHTKPLYKYMTYNWTQLQNGPFKKLAKMWGVEYNQNEMRIESQSTSMRRLSAQGSDSDGDHYTTGIVDEYHLFGQGERSFVNSMTSGMVNNPTAQMFYISTAGLDPNTPMFEDYKRYAKCLENGNWHEIDKDLVLIWEQDDEDEAYLPDTWQKSNPLMELPNMRKNLTEGMITERDAKVAQGKLSDFIVKNMNMWQNAKDNAFLPLDLIQGAIIDEFNMYGRDVFIGFDYSQTNDDTSLAFVFPYIGSDGQQKYHLYQHSWVPISKAGSIEAKEQRDNIDYRDVERRGFATITRDRFGLIDEDEVFNWLLTFIEQNVFNVQAILYDQWGTGKIIRRLDEIKNEFLIIPVRQGIKSLNEPTKFLQSQFIKQNITMLDDQAMQQALVNAVVVSDNNGIKVDKNVNSQKIDVVDAIINAFYEGQWYNTEFTNADVKEKSFFDGMSPEEISDYYMKLTF